MQTEPLGLPIVADGENLESARPQLTATNTSGALGAPAVTNADSEEAGGTQHQPHAPIKSSDDELIFSEPARRGRPRAPRRGSWPDPYPSPQACAF
jgi:hypothetical protein